MLLVADGTPRNCALNSCGSQADTAIIRDADMRGGGGALGKTQGNGQVDPANVISVFMGTSSKSNAPTNKGSSGAAGVEDDLSGLRNQRREEHKRQFGQGSGFFNLPGIGALGMGGKKSNFATETIVADTAGEGAKSGLPTSDDSGVVSLVYRQVSKIRTFYRLISILTRVLQINQDGAGPLTAAIDPSSGGYDNQAFQTAKVTQDVPGAGIGGLSLATNTDFAVKVQMPDGMVCTGKVGGAENVCVVRVRNQALAGPFGGAAAFTQSEGARKRAVAYRLKKRYEF